MSIHYNYYEAGDTYKCLVMENMNTSALYKSQISAMQPKNFGQLLAVHNCQFSFDFNHYDDSKPVQGVQFTSIFNKFYININRKDVIYDKKN